MKDQKKKRIFYYKDESNDDFMTAHPNVMNVNVDSKYNYMPNFILFKLFSFVFYYLIAIPLLSVANLFFFGVRVRGRKNLKGLWNKGYFIYANHTNYKDAWLTPVSIAPFRKNYVIANKAAVEIPVVNYLAKAGGVLPVADTMAGLKKMTQSIDYIVLKKKQIITVFPEAHIWPYYTKLRPFPLTSFKFSAKTKAPSIPVAVCYKKRAIFGDYRKPKAVAYIGKPIFPLDKLTERENAEYLRDKTFEFIKNTIEKESTYSYIEYVKVEQGEDTTSDFESEKEAI